MMDKNTDFFKIVNHFEKIKYIKSIQIIEAKLDFTPKITIAIPTYKRGDLLKEAIDSAINQFGSIEYDIIVVDNDPTRDCGTERLMHTYNSQRLSYFKNSENIQMAGNWNRCFELAKGEYVLLLHDDDLLLPTFNLECIDIINQKNDVGILKPLAYNCAEKEVDISNFKIDKKINRIERLYDFSNFDTFKLGAPTGCIFKKEYVIKLGGFNQDFYPMMDFCFTVLFSQKYPVYLYHKKLSIYRILINESLKLSTLLSSFEGVFYFRKALLLKYKIPSLFIDAFLSCNLTAAMGGYKQFNKDFHFDIRKLGLAIPSRIKIISYIYLVKSIDLLLRFITYEKSTTKIG
jgi:glycosyltransferase involved in cell wall biosynthesis